MKPVYNIALVWDQYGPHHKERAEALGRALCQRCTVHGIEIASRSQVYLWAESGRSNHFVKHTLFPNRTIEAIPTFYRTVKLMRCMLQQKIDYVFIANYHRLDTFLLSGCMRILGRRVYLMSVSKFDDKRRAIWLEVLKSLILRVYNGALVAGPRSEDYLRFLGFRKRPVVTGFNTVLLGELVKQAGCRPAPKGPTFGSRHFVLIGRFVAKKDIATAIAAYAKYRKLAGGSAREFHLCGSGPLEGALRAQIAKLNLEGVVLHGFLQREGIARVLAGGLALIMPSVEEQWGLAVNEALAFCLPILATDQVGARDLLVRTAVNGYIFEPGNVEGLAHLMLRLAEDEVEWRRLTEGAWRLRHLADTERFAESVLTLLNHQEHRRL